VQRAAGPVVAWEGGARGNLSGLLLLFGLEDLLDEVEDLRDVRFDQVPLTNLPRQSSCQL